MTRVAKVNWRGYASAVAGVAAALLLTVLMPPIRGESPTALFFAAVMISSWYGGLGPGLLATALTAVAIDYFIMPPAYALVLGLGDVVRISVFVLVALLINSLNEARRQLERALRRRAEELAEADRHKDEFLAVLAHEMRNLLAPIRNAIHVLKQRDDPAVGRAREILDRQAGHMTRLVDDLIDAARIARGEVTLRREVFDFAEAVKQAVEVAHPLIEARGHRLSLSLPWEPAWLDADRTRLVQVLSNLLTNAAKYTEPGGEIGLSAERLGETLVLRLKDSGIGIAPEMVARIFDLFVQAGRPRSEIPEGLGIGLSLAKKLVELHGGTIHAQSRGPGCGSEFIVRLPVARAAPVRRDEAVAGAAGPHGRPRRILVVDDDVPAAESLAVILGLWGHEALLAHDGLRALEAAETHRPEVVLVDIEMPGMDGYELVRRLRDRSGPWRVLLIAMTGHVEEDYRRRAAADFDLFLVKPLDLDDLEQLLAVAEHPGAIPPAAARSGATAAGTARDAAMG